MRRFAAPLSLIALLALAAPAAGQGPAPDAADPVQAKPAPPQGRPAARQPVALGFRVFGIIDRESMAASQSFDAVLGTTSLNGFGVGGEVLKLWREAFARVSFARMKKTGTRVYLIDDDVIPAGIPLTVQMTPLEIGGGWRFPLRQYPRFTPYAGYSGLFLNYKETSEFAGPDENTSKVFTGHTLFGGVDVGVGRWISAGVEFAYRTVPNALGDFESGASNHFDETNLGGMGVRVLFGIRK
jgi:hypothetical protein